MLVNRIADRHPDLQAEIRLLTHPQYLNTLSSGEKQSVMKLIKKSIGH